MIKEYRVKNGYTQEQLAELLDIIPRHLQRIEANYKNTRIKTFLLFKTNIIFF